MLRKEQLATFVKQSYASAVQIDHLNKSPTSIQTKLNPDFAKTIETQSPNPAKAYQYQMKRLLSQDLSEGLRDRASSLKNKNRALNNYKEHLDGVLCQLEKNSMRHSLVLQSRLNRQEERKKLFIDDDKLKNSKIGQFIEKRQDRDVFNHGNDQYQQYQKQEYANSLLILQRQKQAKMRENILAQQAKLEQQKNRLVYQQNLYYQNLRDKIQKRQMQHQYGTELAAMMNQKTMKDALDKKVAQTVVSKHNPITNPIEYHVDNPYLLKRMQDRQNY